MTEDEARRTLGLGANCTSDQIDAAYFSRRRDSANKSRNATSPKARDAAQRLSNDIGKAYRRLTGRDKPQGRRRGGRASSPPPIPQRGINVGPTAQQVPPPRPAPQPPRPSVPTPPPMPHGPPTPPAPAVPTPHPTPFRTRPSLFGRLGRRLAGFVPARFAPAAIAIVIIVILQVLTAVTLHIGRAMRQPGAIAQTASVRNSPEHGPASGTHGDRGRSERRRDRNGHQSSATKATLETDASQPRFRIGGPPITLAVDWKPPEERRKVTTENTRAATTRSYLTVKSTPWARVELDGEYIGDAPWLEPKGVTAGSHVIRLTTHRGSRMTRSIQIPAGHVVEVTARFDTGRVLIGTSVGRVRP